MHISSHGLPTLIFLLNIQLFYDYIHQTEGTEVEQHQQRISLHPYFDFDVVRNITARVGQTSFLHCRVEQLGDKSVSWIRKRDLHILTAGILTYTSDERFQVIRPEISENWTLQIKFSQLRDSGIYECQVNTEPKMSMAFRLNVVEAKADILGQNDLYVKIGSIVTLTCVISQGPHELGTIQWYHGEIALSPIVSTIHPNDAYDDPNRISIEYDFTDSLTSRLKISSARVTDSGNYSCMPSAAEGSSVIVHVINGEHPAAMQRGGCANTSVQIPILIYIIIMLQMAWYWKSIRINCYYNGSIDNAANQYILRTRFQAPCNIFIFMELQPYIVAVKCTNKCNVIMSTGQLYYNRFVDTNNKYVNIWLITEHFTVFPSYSRCTDNCLILWPKLVHSTTITTDFIGCINHTYDKTSSNSSPLSITVTSNLISRNFNLMKSNVIENISVFVNNVR